MGITVDSFFYGCNAGCLSSTVRPLNSEEVAKYIRPDNDHFSSVPGLCWLFNTGA